MKRVLTVQDISCLGKCSLTIALPVISALGVETVILPTAVLSTHTMFKNFTCKDLDDQILPIAKHWKDENITFDAFYTGYLASAQQIDKVLTLINSLKRERDLVIVDPAMADNGKLYPAFDSDFPKEMARLAAQAKATARNRTDSFFLIKDSSFHNGFFYRERRRRGSMASRTASRFSSTPATAAQRPAAARPMVPVPQ